jgi:hypothetical protein
LITINAIVLGYLSKLKQERINPCLSFFREFASTITKNFTARYDPYTESIEILDTKREILKNLRGVSREIRTLSDALDRL